MISFLRTIEYWYWDTHHKETPELVHKIVDFFLLHMTGGKLSADSFEVDDAAWFTPAQAVELLTFSSERMVMQDALERLACRVSTLIGVAIGAVTRQFHIAATTNRIA